MSFLLTLDDEKLDQLIPFIEKYEAAITNAEPVFQLTGKKIEALCKDLPHHMSSYDQYYQELKSLEEWLISRREKVNARLWKKYTEGYSRALSAKDIQAYIAGEKDYVAFTEVILEIGNLKGKMQSIVKALEQMGWMLSHITKLRIAEMQDAIL
jgi:hypothetical protein